ncbi:hypothetical protein BDZ97DRAFT_1850180 [Flammula alnicola]|nr:hypothetical protein BDZ97DRAFT_1850180 [Flammula alnicola]
MLGLVSIRGGVVLVCTFAVEFGARGNGRRRFGAVGPVGKCLGFFVGARAIDRRIVFFVVRCHVTLHQHPKNKSDFSAS